MSQVAELLQQMIRNACVNDGTPASGQEIRNAEVLQSFLEGAGIELQRFEPAPGRVSLVGRIEGSDPAAPSLMLMGHTDVVPVNADRWERDPFGGEIVDGVLWGRGAIDMLNMTASMAVAFRKLADEGFRPNGTLIYLAVADEEALGDLGAGYLTTKETDAVRADYVITEAGGFPFPTPGGTRLPVLVAERGPYWCRLRVRGTPGHGSIPFGTDNALVKIAEVVRRIGDYRAPAMLTDEWRAFVTGLGLPAEVSESLLDPARIDQVIDGFPPGLKRAFHSCTHLTMAPTVLHGGAKLNVIPDTAELELDIRMLPGQSGDDVRRVLDELIGDLDVEIVSTREHAPTRSPSGTPLWDTLRSVSSRFYPDGELVPMLMVGATDARFFRDIGAIAYGYSLFSRAISIEQIATMGHGDNERIDLESLDMCVELWDGVAREFLTAEG